MAKTAEQMQLPKHDTFPLDLALVIDCSQSLESCISDVRINSVVEEILGIEDIQARIALIKRVDDSPEDTKSSSGLVHDFTASPGKLKQWLAASRRGDCGYEPKGVANTIGNVLTLHWSDEATKICVCISEAPVSGLFSVGKEFQNGSLLAIDLITVSSQLAEKNITLYIVGFGQSVRPCDRISLAMAYVTGGQYLSITNTQLLAKAVVGTIREDMSLEKFKHEVDREVNVELDTCEELDEYELCEIVHAKLFSKGTKTIQLQYDNSECNPVITSTIVKALVNLKRIGDRNVTVREILDCLNEDYLEPYEDDESEDEIVDHTNDLIVPGCDDLTETKLDHDVSDAVESSFETVEKEISYAQSCRMVIKSIARNMKN